MTKPTLLRTNATPVRAIKNLSLAAALGLALTACGTASGPTPDSFIVNGPIPSFTFGISSAPISLDITKDYSASSMQVQALLTEPLERLGSGGELVPHLAESVTTPDPTTIQYSIRPNVHFSDGTTLGPDDVVWSIRHVADAAAGAQTAGELQSVASVDQTGPMEVTVKLAHPDPVVRQSIALLGFIQQAHFAEAHSADLGTEQAVPVGTGPYRSSSYTSSGIELTRNNEYWAEKPAVETLKFDVISDNNTAQLAMRSGDIQAAAVDDPKKINQWKQISGVDIFEVPVLSLRYISFDTSTAPFNDIHVRKAVAYSIDRRGIAEAAFGNDFTILKGMAIPEMLTSVAGSATDAQAFLDQLDNIEFDSTRAEDELLQSGHPEGFTVEIPYIDNVNWMKLTALSMQQNLSPLGIVVVPKAVTQTQWISDLFSHNVSGIRIIDNAASTPDPQIVGTIVGAQNAVPQKFNTANWSTDQVEQALPILNGSLSDTERWNATQSILTEINNEIPYVPLVNSNLLYAVAGGFTFDKKVTFFDFVNGSWITSLKATA